MILKRLFDILASFFGLLILWPVLVIVAILVKRKSPTRIANALVEGFVGIG